MKKWIYFINPNIKIKSFFCLINSKNSYIKKIKVDVQKFFIFYILYNNHIYIFNLIYVILNFLKENFFIFMFH
jgi:hypothetical protein